MAYTRYTGRHRVQTVRASNSCFAVQLKRPAGHPGAEYPNTIGRVCYRGDRWKYSYVGGPSRGEPIYGGYKTKREAVKNVVASYRSWIGDTTQMDGSRRRRRR